MKYKILCIKGSEINYMRRVYMISKKTLRELSDYNTFTLRETVKGEKVYRSVEDDKCYMIVE